MDNKIITYLMRILSFPFVAGIMFIWIMILYVIILKNQAIYGGETNIYNKKMNRKTIQDVYNKLDKLIKKESNEKT